MSRTHFVYRYVTFEKLPDYLALGWVAHPALEGCHHGYYGVLAEWLCDCKLVEPKKELK